jgi:site-specific DNA-methyltransferase (cytosine-N4-specific)
MGKQFTYGDQFSAGSQVELDEIVELIFEAVEDTEESLFDEEEEVLAGSREVLRRKIADKFFDHTANAYGNAGNTVLSLNAYELIDIESDRFATTDLSSDLAKLSKEEAETRFAEHILANLDGLLVLKLIEDMKGRGMKPGKESINLELQELGYDIAPNVTYVSTMKSWLHRVGVFTSTSYSSIDWGRVRELTGFGKDVVDKVYDLERVQRYYLLSLVQIGAKEFTSSSDVAEYTRTVFRTKVTTTNLVSEVLTPLEEKNLIETKKTTSGRGAKPHLVRLTEKSKNEVLENFLTQVQKATELPFPTLNKSFEEAIDELNSNDSHKKGKALELLAVWMVRLLGLRFTEWRVRSEETTGGGEVDVMAASDKYIYNRWQIQCKNTSSRVGVNTLAKEYGLSVITNADVIMVVTTSGFTTDARTYAEELMNKSRFYIVLIDGKDIEKIKGDKTSIVEILNNKAEKVFFRKEVLSRTKDSDESDSDNSSPPSPPAAPAEPVAS